MNEHSDASIIWREGYDQVTEANRELTARLLHLQGLAQRVIDARYSTRDDAWDEMKEAIFNLQSAIK